MSSQIGAGASGSVITLAGEGESAAFARMLAADIKGGMIVGFSGTLGAGKTTLIRLLVGAIGGISPVSSPTYVLQHEYPTTAGVTIDHWDLYRLSELPEELQGRCPANRVWLIEWPERIPEFLPVLDMRLTVGFPEVSAPADYRLVSIEKRPVSEV